MAPPLWRLSGIFPASGECSVGWGHGEILAGQTDHGGSRPSAAVPWSISQKLPGQHSLGLVLLHPRAYHIQLSPGIQSSQREWGGPHSWQNLLRLVGEQVKETEQDTLSHGLEESYPWILCVLMSHYLGPNSRRLRYREECPKKDGKLQKGLSYLSRAKPTGRKRNQPSKHQGQFSVLTRNWSIKGGNRGRLQSPVTQNSRSKEACDLWSGDLSSPWLQDLSFMTGRDGWWVGKWNAYQP